MFAGEVKTNDAKQKRQRVERKKLFIDEVAYINTATR